MEEDDDEPQEENGERSANPFTAMGLGSGLEDEDDWFTSLNMFNAESDMEEIATEDQKHAMIEFANAYAKKVAQESSASPVKRTFDIARDHDEDDDDDAEDPMSSNDAWSYWLALTGGQVPWRR